MSALKTGRPQRFDVDTEMLAQSSTPHRPKHAKRPIAQLFEGFAHDHSSIEDSDVDILGTTEDDIVNEPSILSFSTSQSLPQQKLGQSIFNITSNIDGDPFQSKDIESDSESIVSVSTSDTDSIILELNKSGGETTEDEAESYIEKIKEIDDVEIDVTRSFVLPDDTEGNEQNKKCTIYFNDSMDLANESLLFTNIEQTVQGNLETVKRKLESEIDNRISTFGKDLTEDNDVVNLSRFIESIEKLKELKGAHCVHLTEDDDLCGAKLNFTTNQRASVFTLSWSCTNRHAGS
eukprot:gene10004-18630_t